MPSRIELSLVGSTSTPESGVTNSGGPPTCVATTGRPAAIPSSSDWPNGSTRLGPQTTRAAASRAGTSSCGTRPVTEIPARPSRCGRSGPSPTKVSVPSPEPLECVRQPQRVLPLGQRADTDERRRPRGRRLNGEQPEVDAAVDDLDLAARGPDLALQLFAEPLGDCDDRGRAAHDVGGRAPDARDPPDVRDVLAVGGDDERRAGRERSCEARRDEEVRVHDLRLEAAGDRPRIGDEPHVAAPATAAAVHDRTLELVTTVAQRLLHLLDEDAEIRVVRPRVHLRDEEDAHPP